MAGGRLSGLAQLRRTVQSVRDGDVAGAAWQLAKSALLVKIGLPLLALLATVLIIVVVIVGALAKAGNAAAQACGSGVEATPVSLNTSGAGPVGPPAPANDIPTFQAAAVHFGLGPQGPSILAAINEVETTFATSELPGVHSGANAAGAEGPMQFEPGTWAKYGMLAPGGADPASVYDETDAVWSAANLLHASGAPGDWQTAIFAYNHAGWYVDEVLSDAADDVPERGGGRRAGVKRRWRPGSGTRRYDRCRRAVRGGGGRGIGADTRADRADPSRWHRGGAAGLAAGGPARDRRRQRTDRQALSLRRRARPAADRDRVSV